MAVGSIKCNGEKATDSACGEELEVVAPGQEVTSVGPFGMLDCFSGSSMASPQVAALASILWQQDITKSNEFIRQLIDISANPLGDKESFGYGLIDCKCALEKYKEFEQCFSEKKTVEENVDLNLENEKIDANSSELICVDEERVKGYWSEDDHRDLSKGTNALKEGAVWPDYEKSEVAGMVAYPEFHGYFGSENDKVNYIKAYIFMTKVASNMYHKSTKKNINMNNDVWMIPESTSDSNYKFAVNIKTAAEAGFKKYKCKTKIQKSNFIYGMALHTVADIFAHSAYGISLNKKDRKELLKTDCTLEELVKRWDRFKHGPKDKDGHYYKEKNFADMKDCIEMRYKQSAKSVCNAIINNHIVEKQTSTKNKKGKNITKTDYQHTIGKVDVFKHVSYYYDKDNKNAWKYDKLKKKDEETDQEYEKRILTLKCNYVIQSYGLKNFLEYCKDCGADKDLKKLASNVDEDKIQELMDKWVQDEKEKAKEESKK